MAAILAGMEADEPARPGHTHDDHAVRVGKRLAWKCSTCERIEMTEVDLLDASLHASLQDR